MAVPAPPPAPSPDAPRAPALAGSGAWRRGREAVPVGLGGRAAQVGAAVWVALVVVGVVWGTVWVARRAVALRAAPVMGHWSTHPGVGLAPAAAVGVAAAWWGPRLAARAPWRAVPALTGVTAAAWTVALAASDGWSRLTEPLTTRHEYEPLAAQVDGLLPFLDTYVDRLGDYPIHVQGHPPGPVVAAWALDRVGLGGAGWLAVVMVAAWGLAAGAALVAARAVASERAARRAAPALAVLPAAVWAGTSLDPLFAALGATGIALVAHPSRRGTVAGGATLGLALLCSYGVVPLLLVAGAAVAVTAGRARSAAGVTPVPATAGRTGATGRATIGRAGAIGATAGATAGAAARARAIGGVAALAAGAGLAVLAAAAAAGFWWPDGLAATRDAYWAGVAADRPALYLTLVGNPAALALAVGPATAAGLAAGVAGVSRLVRRFRGQELVGHQPLDVPGTAGAWVLPLAALAAVTAADLSQLSRGEVERIWLPFVPWLALAAPGDRRPWLAAQVAVALVLQSVLVSPW